MARGDRPVLIEESGPDVVGGRRTGRPRNVSRPARMADTQARLDVSGDLLFGAGEGPVGVVGAAQAPVQDVGAQDGDPGHLLVAVAPPVSEGRQGPPRRPDG